MDRADAPVTDPKVGEGFKSSGDDELGADRKWDLTRTVNRQHGRFRIVAFNACGLVTL